MTKQMNVAIQGIAGSFHEEAARSLFGDDIRPVECLTFHELCDELASGDADAAVMAIENSIAGSILPNYALLERHDFSITGELYLPIHHHLLALPGVSLSEIRCIESHPMAISQCFDFVHSLGGVAIRESDDTALSAKRVAENRLRETAAIGSARAAEVYGLAVLARGIETNSRNFTRFLALERDHVRPPRANKASLVFEVANRVGSLAQALTTFEQHDLNLLRIQSIPILGRPAEYSMHVDVEWRKRQNFDDALSAIRQRVLGLRILGEYRRAAMRFR